MSVTVRFVDREDVRIDLENFEATVGELRAAIAERVGVDSTRVRIIAGGRMLIRDEHPISQYGISPDRPAVNAVVTRDEPQSRRSTSGPNPAATTQQQPESVASSDIMSALTGFFANVQQPAAAGGNSSNDATPDVLTGIVSLTANILNSLPNNGSNNAFSNFESILSSTLQQQMPSAHAANTNSGSENRRDTPPMTDHASRLSSPVPVPNHEFTSQLFEIDSFGADSNGHETSHPISGVQLHISMDFSEMDEFPEKFRSMMRRLNDDNEN